MKNRVLIAATVLLLLIPEVCLSSYLIKLKNGATFITNQYWEEGNQIKFYSYDGVMGIEKALVNVISESVLPVYQPTSRQYKPNHKAEDKPVRKIDEKLEETPVPINDINHYKKKKAAITKKLRIAENELISATLSGDVSTRKRTKKKYFEIRKELFDLQKSFKEKNDGTLPEP